ncbi:salicylate hydroxylase [Cryphonectria parasitica EP155]|uniref:Salicylate hydroxylase n=1 Tax=Cryphonectria parasitica (strain ATCC 38755 / EP155) TaxID=660469 RepID=A0A9P5CVV3_CRYP1|nr:salicylate hydroxylase [Cryphonectria parasitica EP155]KAF3771321.1 salicylate hydroxylase [Cryphonectria parasitica EP155]
MADKTNTNTSAANQPRIAIAGGGPGALTLGVLLSQRNIPFTIYELRPRPTEAQLDEPSGSLDLHDGSGLDAIRACGLFDQFLPYTTDCEDSMVLTDMSGAVVHSDSAKSQEDKSWRPEIARNNITRLLLGALPEGCVQWGTKVVKVENAPVDGTTTGEEGQAWYDLVIGADGAWSKVRPLLSQAKVELSGVQWFPLVIPSFSSRFPEWSEYTGRGMFLCLGNRHMLCSMRGVRDCAYVVLSINGARAGNEAAQALGTIPLAEAKQRVLGDEALLGAHGDKIKDFVGLAFDEQIKAQGEQGRLQAAQLVALPQDHRWDHRPHATLIGDAAHVMLPSGEGVNLAMLDALDVSRAVGEAWTAVGGRRKGFQAALSPLLKKCEEGMHARAQKEAAESVAMNNVMLGPDGAQGMVKFMEEMMARMQAAGAGGPGGRK